MASFMTTRSQICKNGGISSQAMPQPNMNVGNENCLLNRSQDKIGNIVKVKNGADKMIVAPGSLGSFLRMKEQLRTNIQLSKQNGLLNQPVDNSQKPPENYSRVREKKDDKGRRFGLVDEDEDFQSSGDDYVVEEQVDSTRLANNINENTQVTEKQLDLDVLPEEKRTRGPTICKEVNSWNLNERRPIFLNENREPVGPDKGTLTKFSQFCGSLARDSVLAPLNFLDWRHVSDKDKLWEIKKKHYFQYDNDEDRWESRPRSISDAQFMELLNYWSLEEVKEKSDKNKKNSEAQKDRHTMGPISFAIKRHELEQVEKKPPSLATMYMETCKRSDGRKYKTSYVEKLPEVGKHKLMGKPTKNKEQPPKFGVQLIPDEVLQQRDS
ncbi:Unknown protein [Striga hermonthica]|uniref:Uncharacterized protein n=1 Tax=Striga hermonthica TaxID=68872 RepID=A0A9N7NMA0_STRHE|nr:Unknown protein [Striga hermonthica]